MEIRNIIFDLGGVLVSLDQRRCIEAMRQVGIDAITNYVEERRTEDLFYEAEIGAITQHGFCAHQETKTSYGHGTSCSGKSRPSASKDFGN